MSIAKRLIEEEWERNMVAADREDTDWLADVDIAADAKSTIPEDDKIQMLRNLADYYVDFEKDLANAEALLKVATERFRRLREEIIPEKMKEFGVKRFILDDGSELGYKEIYAGKVLDDAAYDWLEANGYADAVKQEMKLEVSRVDSEILDEVKNFVKSFNNLSIKEKQSIHHMTLGSVIRELTKAGKQLPQDLIETFIGNRATLKGKKNGENLDS